MFDAPDRAVGYNGNEHRIEANDLGGLCRLSGDAAAIYSGNWMCGNKVHRNFIHDVESAPFDSETHGSYIDDGGAGADAVDNFFYRIDGAACFFNGGRDNEAGAQPEVRRHSALHLHARPVVLLDRDREPPEPVAGGGSPRRHLERRVPLLCLIPNTVAAIEAAKDTWLTPRGCVEDELWLAQRLAFLPGAADRQGTADAYGRHHRDRQHARYRPGVRRRGGRRSAPGGGSRPFGPNSAGRAAPSRSPACASRRTARGG